MTFGPFFVKRKTSSKEKIYYVSQHNVANEYFALELLQYLGINTPKLRVTTGSFANKRYHPEVVTKNRYTVAAVKGLPSYLTIDSLLDPKPGGYRVDYEKQLVEGGNLTTACKINGNVFAAFIGAWLVNDDDFGFKGSNFGMMHIGSRFYSAAIHKDCAKFNNSNIMHESFRYAPLFATTRQDQELFVVSRIAAGLKPDATGRCDFDRIFASPRVLATPDLAEDHELKCQNLKMRAQKIIQLYQRKDADCLQKFHLREDVRKSIVNSALGCFELPRKINKEQLSALLLEDLRGPYYHLLFKQNMISTEDLHNPKLLDAIQNDISSEFGLQMIASRPDTKRHKPRK